MSTSRLVILYLVATVSSWPVEKQQLFSNQRHGAFDDYHLTATNLTNMVMLKSTNSTMYPLDLGAKVTGMMKLNSTNSTTYPLDSGANHTDLMKLNSSYSTTRPLDSGTNLTDLMKLKSINSTTRPLDVRANLTDMVKLNSSNLTTRPLDSGANLTFTNFTHRSNHNDKFLHALRKRETTRDITSLLQIRIPAEEIEGRQKKELTPSKCRYYCFHRTGQFVCCEFAPIKSLKSGDCPKVRPYCSQALGRSANASSVVGKIAHGERCVEDDSCQGPDKCCFDRCFMTSVCKTPVNVSAKS